MQRNPTLSTGLRILSLLLCALLVIQTGPVPAVSAAASAPSPAAAATTVAIPPPSGASDQLLRPASPSDRASAAIAGSIAAAPAQPVASTAPAALPYAANAAPCTPPVAPVLPPNHVSSTVFLPIIAGGSPTTTVASLRTLAQTAQAVLPNPCLAYAVHDAGINNSQFFTIDTRTHAVAPLGPLHKGYDIEGIDLHPQTQELYATAGSDNRHGQDGYLYRVDKTNGALIAIGRTGFSEVVGLSFRPDGTLWGWSEGAGLIRINRDTGSGSVVFRSKKNIEGLAWSLDGARLYAVSGKKLLRYDPRTARLTQIATNLPGTTEGLDMRPDGRLVGGIDGSGTKKINLFTYDVTALRVVSNEQISTPYDDVESIAWPERCNAPGPSAIHDAYSLAENSSLSVPTTGVLANDSDPTSAPLTALLVNSPLSGTLTLNPDGSFHYTPNANYVGADRFSYKANNGTQDSNSATVTINITAVNTAPAIVSAPIVTAIVSQPYRYAVDAFDPDVGDTLTFALDSAPAGMTIDPATGVITWTPSDAQLCANDVAVRVHDAAGLFDTQRFTITVGPPASAPGATDDAFSVDEDHTLNVPAPGVLANDSSATGGALTVLIDRSTTNGTLTLYADGSFNYTPNSAHFTGSDSFVYKLRDGNLISNAATVTITVNPLPVPVPNVIGMAPLAATKTITEAQLITGTITTVDGAITLDMHALPSAQGWIFPVGGSIPEARVFSVSEGVLHQTTLGIGGTGIGYRLENIIDPQLPFTIAVRARVLAYEGEAPTNACGFDIAAFLDSEEYELCLSPTRILGYGPAGPTIFSTTIDNTQFHDYRMEATPGVGYQLFVDNVLLGGTAPEHLSGFDVNWLTIGDGTAGPNANVDIASYAFSQPRVIAQSPVGGTSVLKGSAVDLVVATGPAKITVPNVVGQAQADAETTITGAKLTVGAITTATSPSVPAGQVISQNPLAGTSVTAGASVAIVVSLGAAPNQAPVAADDTYTVDVGTTLTISASGVLSNDIDPNNDPLIAALIAVPAHGALTLHPDGSFSYTPNGAFNGTDSFTYVANDRQLASNMATVTLTVPNAPMSCDPTTSPAAFGSGAGPGGWVPIANMASPRSVHAAILLHTGKVLIVGGNGDPGVNASAELYDPSTGTWSPAAPMSIARSGPTATLLKDGRVLVVGGFLPSIPVLASAEIYDPVTDSWTPAASMHTPRTAHTATLLPDGTVLAVGGLNVAEGFVASTELYDPATNTWSQLASMASARYEHTATLLPDGTVLAVGGHNSRDLTSVERYDRVTNTWSPAASLGLWRFAHTASLLDNGKVLIAGGRGDTSAELYDPAANSWSPTPDMHSGHTNATATILADGSVLIAGGYYSGGIAVTTVDRYDPTTNTWSLFAGLSKRRASHTATLLGNGIILVTGGSITSAPTRATASAELYQPGIAGWVPAADMRVPRSLHSATMLPDCRILVVGGMANGGARLSSVEIYDPITNTWAQAASMRLPRFLHTATLLANGKVLVVGGVNASGNDPTFKNAELYDPATNTWSDTGSMSEARYTQTATRLCDGRVLVTGGFNGDPASTTDFASTELYDPASNTWSHGASMSIARDQHAAILLNNCTVLIIGGSTNRITLLASAEIYNPATDRWSDAGSLTTARANNGAVRLADGKVLVIGGYTDRGITIFASTEQYDPTNNSWSPAAAMHQPRHGMTAVLLGDGTVLATGGAGYEDPLNHLATAERYDPLHDQWTRVGSMHEPRAGPGPLMMRDGRVLLIGGHDGNKNLATTEFFDPRSAPIQSPLAVNDSYGVDTGNALTVPAPGILANDHNPGTTPLAATLVTAPSHGTLVLNPDGSFTYTPNSGFSGQDSFTYKANDGVLDSNIAIVTLTVTGAPISCDVPAPPLPGPGAGPGGWVPISNMLMSRSYFTATRLPDGKVLMVGGRGGGDASAEIYDPATQLWHSAAPPLNARNGHTATLLANGKVLVTGGRYVGTLVSTEIYDPATDIWSAVAALHTPRFFHTATLLADGTILVTGGYRDNVGTVQSAERYDPIADTWSAVPAMGAPRYNHTATLLSNGKVLITGGRDSAAFASAELYDPETNSWTTASSMSTARFFHTATRLLDGKVLVTGGDTTKQVEIYDPVLNTWTLVESLGTARSEHTATLLPSGQVVVAGGPSSTAEIYDPATSHWSYFPGFGITREAHTTTLLNDGTILIAGGHDNSAALYRPGIAGWLPTANMASTRVYQTATLLANGKVLVAGGLNLASAEIYDPATDTWSPAASMHVAHARHTATLLANGKVLVVGGFSPGPNGPALTSAELYDPATNTWSDAGNLHDARYVHTATLLCSGKVLVAGGYNGDPSINNGNDLASVELYDPATNSWSLAAPMSVSREHHAATLLKDGKMLVTGGFTNLFTQLTSAEIYNPTANTWSPAGNMTTARGKHQSVLLADGSVLIAGGYADRGTRVFSSAELYDPTTNSWSPVGSMQDARYGFAMAVLGDGTVLATGGAGSSTLASAERYDPITHTWSRTGSMQIARAFGVSDRAALVLGNGLVLVVSGADNASALPSAEIYDPRSTVMTPLPPLASADSYRTNVGVALTASAPGVLANDGDPNGDSITATRASGPAHGTLTLNPDGSFSYIPTAGFRGSDSFTYTASDGALTSNIATVTIDLNAPPVISSTPITTTPAGALYRYDLAASDADAGDRLRFALTTAPGGMAINPLNGSITWQTSSVDVGPHTVEVQVSDGRGGTITQRYTLIVTPVTVVNTAPLITSTPIITAAVGAVYAYQVSATDAEHDPLTFGLLTFPAGMTIISTTGAIRWTPSSTQLGSYPIVLRVADGRGGVAVQRYTLTVVALANTPPIITTTPDSASIEGLLYRYDLDALDADADPLSFRLASAPAGMTIDPATGVITWIANDAQAGIYGVVAEVTDGRGGTDSQSFAIMVGEAINNSPVITSTPGNTAVVGALYQYQVLAIDADHDLLTYSLAITPTGLTMRAETGLIEWTPTGAQLGDYPLTVRVDDGRGLTSSQSFVLHVRSQPVAADRTPPSIRLTVDPPAFDPGGSARITIAATDNVGVTSRTLTVNGTALPLDASGQATFTRTTPGLYPVIATASDASGNTASATTSVRVNTPGDTTLPIASLTSPDDDTVIRSVTNVIGTASDANLVRYELSLSPAGEHTFTPFASGATSVVGGVLGHLDPTLLQNGMYQLRLTVTDISGNSSTDERMITIEGAAKVGIFTLSFTDLEIPVAGLPIQVVRTYDSRDKRVGDFGVGWTLDIKTVRLQTNGPLGANWQGTQSGGVLNRVYCIQETRTHIVTVTLPDGTVQKFRPTLTPQCQRFAPILQVTLGFAPLPGTTATLAPLESVELFPDDANPGAFNLVAEIDNPTPYNPSQFVLTLHDGRRLLIDRQAGLQQVSDLNGNMLTITRDGISHSSNGGATIDKHVTFVRDALGRISGITDPRGATISYSYDANGDLVSVTDQLANRTAFGYNANHDLLTITDPRGIQPIRNEYDEAGRLIAHTDANGNRVVYTHAIGAGAESVQDRLGGVTFYSYNERGDVTSQTDALGNTTSYTYDTRGNTLSESDALGHVTRSTYDAQDNLLTTTDALGHSSSYTYNDRGQLLTTRDPLGHITTNSYAANGNLAAMRDPLGNTTSYTYNAQGLQNTMTDALGQITRYAYDGTGNLTSETDALNQSTTFTYDENGNRLSQTSARATNAGPDLLTTSYAYDNANRLISTTYPDHSTSQVTYNSIGQQNVTTDQLGRQTHYTYDDQGRLIATTYPDGASETSTYDAEGRRVSSADRAGHATASTYDALGRVVTTTAPDGAATTTSYNAIGQTIAATDALGNTTRYEYDPAGRQIKVTDALSHTTTFSYDDAGNQRTITDARGNATSYDYDENSRRTQVSYADGTRQTTSYDALGRSIAQTDQAGKTTQYGYDQLGRLINVTDALGQITRYTYDEQGNQIIQTDALGRTTRFAYDSMGRRVSRTLPLGMNEAMAYDQGGQLTQQTDFNGHTTSYAYDVLGRLTRKTPDPRLAEPQIAFDYTPSGQRAHMLDASGVTTYTYDLRDRLTSKATAWGTLNYSYDVGSNLRAIHSSNANGASMDYAYDALNRLSSVQDNTLANGTTTYAYDANGNLAGYEYPNQTRTSYTYDTLNRLTVMSIARPALTLASYAYTLGPSGNRTAVAELSGRRVGYSYDDLYRLTNETISGATAGNNGAVGYSYDAVGNRLARTSTLAPVPASSAAYDANDRLTGDSYDANGNTLASGGHTYAYDFENHLTSMDNGAVTYVYDGDGNRVSKTVGGITTRYLVDDRNPTGYAQVLDEIVGGVVARSYTYGLDLISQRQAGGVSFYGYDGHGSVRLLTDAIGNVTDRYDYDAFGIVVGSTGTTANAYLYSGEQYDSDLGLQYLRARYMKQETGRFWAMDTYEGDGDKPLSFHKYLYASNNPVTNVDPSGTVSLTEFEVISSVTTALSTIPSTNRSPEKSFTGYVRLFAYPLGVYGPVISTPEDHRRYRPRNNWESDNAVDIGVPSGTPVYAVDDGVIVPKIGALPGNNPKLQGLRLHLRTRNNEFYYAHLSQILPRIAVGVKVYKGYLLGYSGRADGVDHLHFGVRNGDPRGILSRSLLGALYGVDSIPLTAIA